MINYPGRSYYGKRFEQKERNQKEETREGQIMFATMSKEEVLEALTTMQDNPEMVTKHAYSPNTELWPDNRIPFVEVHMAYLRTHKNVDPKNYLSNLRLMIKNRG